MSGGKTTISSIAREAGVTPSVVSRLFKNTSKTVTIGAETKKRILKIAWDKSFRPNDNIGLLTPSELKKDGAYYYPMATGFMEECAKSGLGIFNGTFDESSDEIPELLLKRQVSAAAFLHYIPETIMDFLNNEKIPFVIMNPTEFERESDSVMFNDYDAMKELLEHLRTQRFRKFVLATFDISTYYAKNIVNCFKDFLCENNYQGLLLSTSHWSIDEINEKINDHVRAATGETALITSSRLFTMKFLEATISHNKSFPKDLGIAGSSMIGDFYIPNLTNIRYPFYEMGASATQMIMEKWKTRNFNMDSATIRVIVVKNESTKRFPE